MYHHERKASRKQTKPWRNYIFYGLEWKIWHVKYSNIFNCKGDNFKLKQIHPSFVVSVGWFLRILSKFISEWETLLEVQITVCLCVCAEMISLQIYWKWVWCNNSWSKQLRILIYRNLQSTVLPIINKVSLHKQSYSWGLQLTWYFNQKYENCLFLLSIWICERWQ